MFVGHLAVALAAKRTSPRTPLSWLVGASFGLDLLWPVGGLDRSAPAVAALPLTGAGDPQSTMKSRAPVRVLDRWGMVSFAT